MFKSDIISKIAKDYLDEFFIFPKDEKSYILIFFYGFKPYSDFKKTSCAISSYYPNSNKVYFLSKAICDRLNEAGIKAEIYKEHNLKEIAFENCGLVKGANTLLYHEKYGSYFVIGAVKIFTNKKLPKKSEKRLKLNSRFAVLKNSVSKGTVFAGQPLFLGKINTNEKKCETNCKNCGKCIEACPVSALKNGEFFREKCLRQKMSGLIDDDLSAGLLKNNILGCEICQRVCPLNSKIEKVAPEKELEDILDISNLIETAEKGNKYLENLGNYIGKNYAKCTRILSLAINSAGNSKEKEYLFKIEKFTGSKDDAVRVNAVRAVKLLKET